MKETRRKLLVFSPVFYQHCIIMDIWQESFDLRFAGVDRSDRLTLAWAFAFFQEAAISHATALGVGRNALADSGQAWVLSRFSVFMEQRPGYGENITVRTWPRGSEKLFALRDYEISESSGKALVRGRASWLVLDLEKRRPLRIEPIIEKLPLNEGKNALLSGPLSIASSLDLVTAGERQAVYSDIDYYGHVNNVRYIQWIQDMIPPDLLDRADQLRLDINYLGETMPGEKVELFYTPISCVPNCKSPDLQTQDYPVSPSAAFAYEGRKTAQGQTVFRAELRMGQN